MQSFNAVSGIGLTDQTALLELRKKQREEKFSFPVTSPSDRVTISEEARKAWAAAQENSKTAGQRSDVEEPEEMTASEEFSSYMQSKRSKAQSGSAEDRVKQLQDKLKTLQSQLYQRTSGNESNGAGNKQVESIQQQISTTIAELAEASAQVAEEKSGAK